MVWSDLTWSDLTMERSNRNSCERDYFHFVRLEKMFLPNGGSMEDKKIFFTVSCVMLSSESYGLVEGMTLRYELK